MVSSLSLVAGLAGCPIIAGLNQDYSAGGTSEGGADVAKHEDARAEAATCPKTCTVKAPPGWTVVAWAVNANATCASDLDTKAVVEVTKPGSCACDDKECATPTSPTCVQGFLTTKTNADGGAACEMPSGSYNASDGGCVTNGIQLYSSRVAVTPASARGGVCTVPPAPSPAETQPAVVCTPPTSCATQACEAAPGSQTCLYQAGDQTCPASMTKHVVAKSVTTPCSCSCTVNLTHVTCIGMLSIYDSQSSCATTPLVTVTVDGGCDPLPHLMPGAAYKYFATASGDPTCDTVPMGSDQLEEQATVCCP